MTINWQSFPVKEINAVLTVPGDKSISHRAVILGALAEGITEVEGFLEGEDCLATIRAFQRMGISITRGQPGQLTINGKGLYGLKRPDGALDLGNSGTSMRLLAGVLAGQDFCSVLTGDNSLLQRPMRRITVPLQQMGADICTNREGRAPLTIRGKNLHGINFHMPVASAQLKSCLLLAGLYAKGTTSIEECAVSRDHSERMLQKFGAQVIQQGSKLSITGGQTLTGCSVTVPGDISSAAFFLVAGLIAGSGKIRLQKVGINPTRAAVIDILQQMGGRIELKNIRETSGEPIADIEVYPSQLHGLAIPRDLVAVAIDEFPILFIAAAYAQGTTFASGLSELRVKESDRLAAMENGLTALGIHCTATEDSMTIKGGTISGGQIDSLGDHRIAMSFAVAAIGATGSIRIRDCAAVATSFPNFRELAEQAGMKIEVL